MELKIGDFFIQKEKDGNMLRRVFADDDFNILIMYEVFDKHGYYPICLERANIMASADKLHNNIQKLEL